MQLFLYQPGRSWLHRRSVASKFLLLAASSVALFAVDEGAILLPAFGLTAALLFSTGIPLQRWLMALRWPLAAVAVLALLNACLLGLAHGLSVGLRLGALVMLASAITATTPVSAMLSAIESALVPLERRGWLHAQQVAFTLSLALTLVPVMFEQLRLARDAQLARGVRGNLPGLLTAVLVRVMKSADELVEAVEARGFPRPSKAQATS